MKAVRVHAWGEAPRVEDLPQPQGGAGRTLVRMHAATVGHIDRTVWSGAFLRHPPLPYVPGVEAAGVVISGERFAPGTRVWMRGAGLGIARDGTWRECIEVPDDALGALPEGVSYALGSAFFSPCTSAWVALHEVAKLRAGERVLVSGASGAVGSIAVQLAREAGAQVDAFDAAREVQPEADLLLDMVGGEVLPRALRGVKPGGRAVLVGYAGGTEARIDLPELLQRDIALLPLNILRREAAARAAAPQLLQRIADGKLQLAVREFSLDQAHEAMQWIATRGHGGRAVLTA
ncbi:zinc-binding dehydrogenase [Ramlibacter sp. USB13]|uniref:Zinc-binding dehydrogenase n=1 Tax=Ramlibacter cellulosilyticus TaxID=2764187 RepID=A0A923MQT8_9BURK|nr:zinc-binding dehydrogenase [Ramlibacter cellulosilyticus]MBC5783770.1 zinc-binding dehydrogenase [Ramlibacter cellulosilyticus]